MEQSKLMNLYREMIVEFGRDPHNFGELENPSVTTELHNPSCGDVLVLQMDIDDSEIKQIKFSGSGCIISQASASMMTDLIQHKSLKEAKKLKLTFSKMITDPDPNDLSELGDAEILQGVRLFPARIKCATLAWNALEKSIGKLEEDNG
ncbi:Fe-S cluster assembly sulfur transfer protein SufU [Xylocopilactobacillus apicola]|uniref:Iron-sulfur cluster assembly scaffold protein n=1 Tax=Xylocopilactobacillus apicola TaxID=2932184 RepID=A0AAU9DSM2_9LACO|nr:SUF system NifU family Fe-S cluster assembly protein [Xylocopilactobacillus apicola]BDR58283.1 iron-sulfur cluster assembly scaffold protein [Xylocopilactobacillus apicola]